MTLITEPGSYKPLLFDDPAGKGKHITYVDVTETTWRQFAPFYNATPEKNRSTSAGERWLAVEAGTAVDLSGAPDWNLKIAEGDWQRPAFNVTYHGALAYCQKMGKELPRKVEWQAAARGVGGKYPWGDKFDNPERLCANKKSSATPLPTTVGRFASFDRSGIGCVDVAGNVAEWCEEFDDAARTRRVVCGGSFNDESPDTFDVGKHRNEEPTTARRWIGFRGVVRIPITPARP
jgi:formylglycine-generating enzyme required for sulfatase activity